MESIIIRGKKIENYCTPYVIAEIGANHNGDIDLAKQLIDSAKATREISQVGMVEGQTEDKT